MSGKNSFGPYDVTQGAAAEVVTDPVVPNVHAISGATEPAWPTTEYATVTDGGITWTAIYARKAYGTVLQMLNNATFQHNLNEYPPQYFQFGLLTWLTGGNAGLQCDVRDSAGVVGTGSEATIPYLQLLEMPPAPINGGDTFAVVVGCTKTRLSCQNFNNIDNMRGFPDMPTEDRALQTPNISSQGYAPRTTK